MRALTIGVLLSVVGLAAIANAEHSPKLYPDSEEFLSGGGTIPGDLTVQSSDAGSAGDPQLTLDRNSASPANADVLGQMIWLGNDSGGADQQYGRCEAVITDVTAGNEDGRLDFYATIAGSPALVCSMDTSVTLYKGIVSSGVATDVTTGTDEALTLAPNGTGDLVADTDLMSVCDGACPAWAGAGTGLGVEGAIEAQGAQSWGGDATYVAGATLSTTTNGSLIVDPDGGGDLNVTLDTAAGSTFTLQSFNAASTAGPTMQQYYADGTPTAEDVIALMNWVGQDSVLNDQTYGYMQGIDVDPTSTSEDFRLETWASIAGTAKKVAEVGMTAQGAGMSLPLADDGALGPTLGFTHTSASPAAADVLGRVIFAGKDSGAADQEYVRLEAVNVDPTVAGGEDGRLDVKPFVAGAQATLMSVGAVPDYSGALVQGIAMQNGEYVRNTADGDICFGGNGGTNPEEICLDLEYAANTVLLKAGASGTSSFYYSINTQILDDTFARFGSGGDTYMAYITAQTPDSFMLFPGADSNALLVAERGDQATDFAFPLQTNPTLAIQSADQTSTSERIWLQHDGTDGKIEVGSGGLKAASPTLTASAATGEYGWVFDQTLNAQAATNDGGITTEVYSGLKINLTTPAGGTDGFDAVYALSVYDDAVLKAYITSDGVIYGSSASIPTIYATTISDSSGGSAWTITRNVTAGSLGFLLSAGSTRGRNIILTDTANVSKNHDHADQTNPTLWVQSATDPDSDNTQWLSFAHDQTNGVISTGKGDLLLAPATSMVAFGGTTSSYPALKRNGTNLQAKLADDSGYASVYGNAGVFYDNLYAGTTAYIAFGASTLRSRLWAPSDGSIKLTDSTNTDFSLLQFGGTTNAFPAWKRSATDFHARLADDSAYTGVLAADFTLPDEGTTVDSGKLYMISDQGGTAATASIYNVHGADPYIRISAPSDAGAETPTLDIHDTAISYGNGVAGVDYKIDFNGETNDGTLTYMEDEDRFDFDTGAKATYLLSAAADPADAGVLRMGNTESVCWEADATGTDVCMSIGADETLATTGGAGASFSTNSGSKAVEVKDTTTSATTGMYISCELVSCDGDTEIDGGDIITDGSLLVGVTTYVQTELTLAAGAGYTVGDGADPDIFGTEAASIVGSATALSDATAHWGNPQLAASDVHITFPGNCSAGAVRICAHLLGGAGPGA